MNVTLGTNYILAYNIIYLLDQLFKKGLLGEF